MTLTPTPHPNLRQLLVDNERVGVGVEVEVGVGVGIGIGIGVREFTYLKPVRAVRAATGRLAASVKVRLEGLRPRSEVLQMAYSA